MSVNPNELCLALRDGSYDLSKLIAHAKADLESSKYLYTQAM